MEVFFEGTWFGVMTMLILLVIYFLAFRKLRMNCVQMGLFLLVIGGLILRLYMASDLYLHTWDERFHALVARNLIKHPMVPTLYDNPVLGFDYQNWTAAHVWLHKQPVPLWLASGSMALFGVNTFALRLPSIIMSTLGILLTFSIARYFYNNRVAFIAAFLFSIHGLIIELAAGRVATDHIDIAFLFFIELSVFFIVLFIQRRKWFWNLLGGVALGLAVLSKWLPALIVLPVWVLLVYDAGIFSIKKLIMHFLMFCAVLFAVFIPWQIYIYTVFPQEAKWEASFNFKHITQVLEEQGGGPLYHVNKLRIVFGELIYIPLIWLVWKTLRQQTNLKLWALVLWIFVPLLFFSVVQTKMQAYMIFTAPAIFITTALFYHYLMLYGNRFKYPRLMYFVALLLLILPIRYTFERAKPLQDRDRYPAYVRELHEFDKSHKNDNNLVIFNTRRPIETMFRLDHPAYNYVPERSKLDSLMHEGYHLVFVNVPDLKQCFDDEDHVSFVNWKGHDKAAWE